MTTKNKLILVIAILQIAILGTLFFREFTRIQNEKSKIITVEAESITIYNDHPNYVSLDINYKMRDIRNFKGYEEYIKNLSYGDIYVILKEENNFFVPDYVSSKKPKINSNQVILLGDHSAENRIYFPYIDSIQKDKSKVKLNYVPSSQDKIKVEFNLYRGSQRSKTVYINGKNIEQYFQVNN
jgi:hypothetical protein